MQVLWWLVPPLAATVVAMLWATWMGRDRDEVVRDDSDAAMARMRDAIAKPAPSPGKATEPPPVEPTHGVALRRAKRQPSPDGSWRDAS